MSGDATLNERGSTPMQWLNARLAEHAVRRAEPLAHHLPTTIIVRGPCSLATLDRVEAELLPFSSEVRLAPGEGEWTVDLLVEWIERCDLARQVVHVDPMLDSLVPDRLRGRAALLRDGLARFPGTRTHCSSPTHEVQLLPDGTVLPCRSDHLDLRGSVGRLDEDGLEALWNGRALRNLRAGLAQRNLPVHCERCPLADGGSPVLGWEGDGGGPSDLLSHFGDGDLAPLRQPVEIASFLYRASSMGLAASYQDQIREYDATRDELEDLREHASNLERRLGGILGSWPYRVARPLLRVLWPGGPRRDP